MTVGIIGPGRLGICFALLLEQAGHSLIVADIRKEYVDAINEKNVISNEPEVTSRLSNSNNIKAVYNNAEVIELCDIIFAIVATPSLPDGRYDTSALTAIVDEFKSHPTARGKTLVITSTTNPGDCKQLQHQLDDAGVHLLYNPEFIAQGSIIQDIQHADILLIGGENTDSINAVIAIYESIQINRPAIHTLSLTAAEVVKVAINCYLTTKISYANIVGQVLISAGLESEIDNSLLAIGSDRRIGTKYLNFGHGFGGPCLPRDNRAFGNYATSLGINFNLGTQIDEFNKSHLNFLIQYYINKNTRNIPFYFKYISYKDATDIFVESQQLELCKGLLSCGYQVVIEDSYLLDDKIKEELHMLGVRFINKDLTTEDLLLIDL